MSRFVRLKSIQYVGDKTCYPGDWVRVGSGLAEHLLAMGLADEGPGAAIELKGDLGAIWVAYGDPAVKEARQSMISVRERHPDLPLAVISNRDPRLLDAQLIEFPDEDPGARTAKLSVAELTPFGKTLYLDADTVAVSSLAGGFYLLESFDLALAVDIRITAQGGVLRPEADLYHEEERRFTKEILPAPQVTQYACGMVFFNKCEDVLRLFEAWQEEWGRWRSRDQAAFLRALHRTPVRHIALPVEWNVKGSRREARVVHHKWGLARRTP